MQNVHGFWATQAYPATQAVGPAQPCPPHCPNAPAWPPVDVDEDVVVVVGRVDVEEWLVVEEVGVDVGVLVE